MPSTPAIKSCSSISRPTATTSRKSSAKTKPTWSPPTCAICQRFLAALEKFNVDTLVHYRRTDRLACPGKFLYRRDQQYSRHDQCPGSCAFAETQTDRLCQHLRRLRSRQDQRQRRSAKPTRSAGIISTRRRKSVPSISFTPMPACITSTPSSFARAAFSAAVFTSAAPLSAWSCAILALNMIKGEPITIDAKVYGPNEYVYGKDVGLALYLACQAKNPKQRIYNAGTGAVHGAEELAQVVRELAPKTRSQSQRHKQRRQKPQYSDGHQRVEGRAGLCAEVSPERSTARLHGRVVG